MADTDDPRKPHRKAHSGRKAEKKDAKKKKFLDNDVQAARLRNPKAFAIQSATKAERQFRRTQDIKSKGFHVPTVDRTPARPPPAVVALIGPPKVGKTTLLKCLVRNFTRQKLTSINGPVTLISGKKKRITFIECNNDINNMIDIAKIADLALLLIDANSGLEMETFEFLNICHVHGMPRMMSVLTHLDLFKNKKTLQRQKVFLRKRIAVEIPRCEKMFYLSGVLYGEYLKNETHNLGRFISVIKYEPSSWKKSHPYVFVDRIEDVTDPESLSKDPDCNRTVCLYGYARGGALKKDSYYHIPGCGDYLIKNIHFLPDPCPLPDKQKKRSLNEKERLIYAPMSGVGGIVYDKDAVYIEMKENQVQQKDEDEKPSDKLLRSIASVHHPIDEKIKAASFQMFPGEEPLVDGDALSSDEEDNQNKDEEEEGDEEVDNENWEDDDKWEIEDEDSSDEESEPEMKKENGVKKRKVTFADGLNGNVSDGSDDENDTTAKKKRKIEAGDNLKEDDIEMGQAKWKENLMQRAADDFYERQKESCSLQKLVYGQKQTADSEDSDSGDELGGLFYLAKHEKEKKQAQGDNALDCTKFINRVPRDWSDENVRRMIKDCFVTGQWHDKDDAEHLLNDDNDDELYGDFEDLETGVVHQGRKTKPESDSDGESDDEEKGEKKDSKENKEKRLQEKRMEKKKKLKEQFNQMFDDSEGRSYHEDLKMEADAQGELNKTEFEGLDDELRVQFEGYRPGLYLRLEVENMPCEFIRNHDPSYPIILGSLLKGEEKMGYLQANIKCHRFYRKNNKNLILKSRDPLIISLGWRRIQTAPIYYTVDHNMRCRYLKYTPEHRHCMAAFWGPITQQKSGVLGVQKVHEISDHFRIAAVGSITEVNQVTQIMKKLKLIGYPREIFRKTAFIKDMFHSPLEVAKYEGAAIKTVSGIKGEIKKAQRTPAGDFRATFEDKILMSDIINLRTWVAVQVPQFCINVTSLLMPPEEKSHWQGSKTTGQLRFEQGLKAPVVADSNYTPIERKFKQFAPLVVPKNLQKALPFKDKIVHKRDKKSDPEAERVAVIKEPKEREIAKFMSMLKTVDKMKIKKENRAMWMRARAHHKEKRKDEAVHQQKIREMKKRIMRRRPAKTPDM
ncbi:hypothetical protein JTE90_000232 [Oedothorax gibbosus]|uniref:Bms1-type G domain-containing protein n=1 Tax=Oedothorax gibbosus TaxID=931172 RepID=A0AAV6VC84_9ARAC|nr:hypothetical protein JTE90_000232 [Oedothorax gibbosus]